MPYFTEHGTLGGIFYFIIIRLLIFILGITFTMSWFVWAILLWGFTVGAWPDIRAIKTNGTWKFWKWKRDDEMYHRTHHGDIAAWFMSRWKQVWTWPYIAHIFIDRPFHNGMTQDKKANWWFGESMHIIVNLVFIVILMMWENAI